MQEKGCVLRQRMNYSTTILAISQQFCSEKGTFWQCVFDSVFPPKKCKRKGVFFMNFARERVCVRRPRWQKIGKSPPRTSCIILRFSTLLSSQIISYSRHHTRRRLGWVAACQAIFWYNNDKDLMTCFCLTQLISPSLTHIV